MPVPKGSPLDPAATRARILDAATRLFAERGVNAVGVNEIAAEAGASKLSLYRYFGSKQQLVAAMLLERSGKVHAWLRGGTGSPGPPRERLLRVFDLLAGWFAEADFHGCVVINTVVDTRATDLDVREMGRAHLQGYRTLLAERLAELDPAPAHADRLAGQLLVLLEGATAVATLDPAAGPAAARDARAAAEALLGR